MPENYFRLLTKACQDPFTQRRRYDNKPANVSGTSVDAYELRTYRSLEDYPGDATIDRQSTLSSARYKLLVNQSSL